MYDTFSTNLDEVNHDEVKESIILLFLHNVLHLFQNLHPQILFARILKKFLGPLQVLDIVVGLPKTNACTYACSKPTLQSETCAAYE